MSVWIKAVLLCLLGSSAWANEAVLEKVAVQRDVASIERGADAMMSACHSCHSLKYVKYRDLMVLGMNKEKVDGWRGEQSLDTPLLAQMSDADAMQSFGKAPPDLSMMTRARNGGANYLYSYLLGYYLKADGQTGNHLYPETKMPDPLGISSATDDAQRTSIRAQARDVVSFLAWAADPHESERIRLGYYVMGYLLVLTTMLYFVKQQIWSRLK